MTMLPLVAVTSTLKEPALTTALEAMKPRLTLVPNPESNSVVEVGVTVTPAGNWDVFTVRVMVQEKPPTGDRFTLVEFPNWSPIAN